MTTTKPNKYWVMCIILLVAIITVASIVIWSRYSQNQPVEISIIPSPELQGEIYISGEVNNPGFYLLRSGDSLESLIQAAGGTSSNADLSKVKLCIPGTGEEELPQKINLNQAETWLLQALPGIGEVRAQAIIDYRQRNGRFQNINELLKADGIGLATYEKIKHLITVAD